MSRLFSVVSYNGAHMQLRFPIFYFILRQPTVVRVRLFVHCLMFANRSESDLQYFIWSLFSLSFLERDKKNPFLVKCH